MLPLHAEGAPSLDGDARTLVKGAPAPEIEPALARTEVQLPVRAPAVPAPSSRPPEVDPAPAPLDEGTFDARYEERTLLGRGGMGEVRLCKDQRIGREIAMKLVHPGVGSRSDLRARFEREARVQGQLEHPSVVPVYDLGIRPDGSAYFTMKRVRGETLAEVIDKLRAGDPEAAATHTRRRLLGAFSGVCLAIAFAHARGVLHRDLKPANVMLGAYGELYILDWGLAKILGSDEAAPAETGETPIETPVEAPLSLRHRTVAGSMMGTPGYMAPEQILGQVDALDERTDVFALGAILFEILTLDPLFGRPGDPTAAVIASTLRGADARASLRAPALLVPAELDAICVRATMNDPRERFASAREIHAAVERVLDGDRDLEQRRALAERHAARAIELISGAAGSDDAARSEALREASAALAIEPAHPGALGLMVRLLIDAPGEMPPGARAELDAQSTAAERLRRRGAVIAYAIFLSLAPALLWLGVRSYPLFGLVSGLAAAVFGVAVWASRGARMSVFAWRATFAASTIFIASVSAFMGPFILVPGLVLANVIGFVLFGEPRDRPLYLGASALALILPIGLELAGLMPGSYAFSDAGMLVLPQLSAFPRGPTLAFLLVANLALILTPSLLIARIRDSLVRHEERLFAYTYRLRQLLPLEARVAGIPEVAPEPEPCHPHLHDRLRLRRPERA